MSMTKKDFVGLADALRHAKETDGGYTAAVADFCAIQNPLFDRERFFAAVNGKEAPVKPTFCQHWRAPNDPNGNPQRLYMVYGPRGEVLDALDEGYRGLPVELRNVPQLPSVEISRSEYHATKREYARKGA